MNDIRIASRSLESFPEPHSLKVLRNEDSLFEKKCAKL